VTNSSTGDQLEYTWSIGPSGPTFSPNNTAGAPKITFPNNLAIGNYVLSVSVRNSVCPPLVWRDTINVSRPPQLTLDSIPDYCETAKITPNAVYNLFGLVQPQDYIDSVRWTLVGACVPAGQTSTLFNPDTVRYCQPGTYTVCVTAYNRCGSATACRTFVIYDGPDVNIVTDRDTVCQGDVVTVTLSKLERDGMAPVAVAAPVKVKAKAVRKPPGQPRGTGSHPARRPSGAASASAPRPPD
jgi:hypothetical protein